MEVTVKVDPEKKVDFTSELNKANVINTGWNYNHITHELVVDVDESVINNIIDGIKTKLSVLQSIDEKDKPAIAFDTVDVMK